MLQRVDVVILQCRLVRRRFPGQLAGVRRLDSAEDASLLWLLPGRSGRCRLPISSTSSGLRAAERLGRADAERPSRL